MSQWNREHGPEQAGGFIDRQGCFVFVVFCVWAAGMVVVLLAADTSPGRAVGVTLVSGATVLGVWLVSRMRTSRRD